MEQLIQRFYEKYAQTNVKSIRGFAAAIDWSNRLIGIKGSRGVGKTTLLLQHIKKNFKPDNKVLYVSLDHFWFAENKLYNLADSFYKRGGELLVLDEVHRYPDWAVEVKNIYDDFSGLKIVFTGSSLLQIEKARGDLSRRAVTYQMPGLSFREFINFQTNYNFPAFTLDEIVKNHIEIAVSVIDKIKPLELLPNYLNYGYYPFYLENTASFHQKLNEAILTVMEIDIPQFEAIQTSNIILLKRLLQVIATSVPFKPNMQAVSQRTGISLNTMKNYLQYLNNAKIITLLYASTKGLNSLGKPEKIYLQNPNLIYNLGENMQNTGNLRETFFMMNLNEKNKVESSTTADFLINEKYTFEIGGRNKGQKQIKDIPDSFIVKDDIVVGNDNIIPLWLFGFLY
ncbi:MAG: ATP-binding protein [Draconibacterium sp.]